MSFANISSQLTTWKKQRRQQSFVSIHNNTCPSSLLLLPDNNNNSAHNPFIKNNNASTATSTSTTPKQCCTMSHYKRANSLPKFTSAYLLQKVTNPQSSLSPPTKTGCPCCCQSNSSEGMVSRSKRRLSDQYLYDPAVCSKRMFQRINKDRTNNRNRRRSKSSKTTSRRSFSVPIFGSILTASPRRSFPIPNLLTTSKLMKNSSNSRKKLASLTSNKKSGCSTTGGVVNGLIDVGLKSAAVTATILPKKKAGSSCTSVVQNIKVEDVHRGVRDAMGGIRQKASELARLAKLKANENGLNVIRNKEFQEKRRNTMFAYGFAADGGLIRNHPRRNTESSGCSVIAENPNATSGRSQALLNANSNGGLINADVNNADDNRNVFSFKPNNIHCNRNPQRQQQPPPMASAIPKAFWTPQMPHRSSEPTNRRNLKEHQSASTNSRSSLTALFNNLTPSLQQRRSSSVSSGGGERRFPHFSL